MKTLSVLTALVVSLFLAQPLAGFASRQPNREPLPNFDKRTGQEAGSPTPERQAALATLRAKVPGVKVEFEGVTGAPRMISVADGFLSGASGQGKAVSAATAARFNSDPDRATKAFLEEHRALLGHGAEALSGSRVKRDFTATNNGMRTVVWQQQVGRIPVFESVLISHTTRDGELVNLSGAFVPDPEAAAERGRPGTAVQTIAPLITPRAGIKAAADNVGVVVSETEILPRSEPGADPELRQRFFAAALSEETLASLVWLPMEARELRLVW
ncbi:MAG: hypothetical protein H7Y43_03810, partial [Akkermansiaceae bacterium]|nr:hypothetical protein [Verrucomicrobiales bacterium]